MAQAELVSIASRARFTGARANPSTTSLSCPVAAAHKTFVAGLVDHPPCPISTAQNVPGRLDLLDAEAIVADLASGAIQKAAADLADEMVGRVV